MKKVKYIRMYGRMKTRHFFYEKVIPFEVAMRRKSGYVSEYWICSFYGSYRASRYFENDPLPEPLFRWKWSRTGKWHVVPEWLMPIFAPFNTYKKTMRGENFMKGTRKND